MPDIADIARTSVDFKLVLAGRTHRSMFKSASAQLLEELRLLCGPLSD